jgi:hypothetical protein
MLVARMEFFGTNSHGKWSGPFVIVTVWDIQTNQVHIAIDLYQPLAKIAGVSIVSDDKFVVLL